MKGRLAALTVGIFLGSVMTLGLGLWVQGSLQNAVAQGGGAAVPIGNGDVNADGEIDLSDAVYILESLFMGGPDVVPIECPPASGGGLPATGQTACYDVDGFPIECTSADYPGQDGFYQTGCPTEGRFIDNGDGTVTDTCTGLMWQKGTADVSGNATIGGEDTITWQAALQYCDALSFAGHDDWRLPNVRELQSIVDYDRLRPAIDPVFEAEPEDYWSSTTSYEFPGLRVRAFFVNFNWGVVSTYAKSVNRYVRAVRGGL